MNRGIVRSYQQQNCLGRGNFGQVFRAIERSSGTEVAIKEIDFTSLTPQLEEMLKREIDTLRTLKSQYIVKLIDVQTHGDSLWLVMEYCKGTNLESYCAKLHQPVREDLVRKWALQLATGMKEMRDKQIVHRDLKLANVMLSSPDPETAEIKICDFGFARFIEENDMAHTVLGTPISTAPEVLEGKPYNHKADLWSLGVLLYELLTGFRPFPALTLRELQSMQKQPISFRGEEISLSAKALLLNLLHIDPAQRPEISEVLAHPFLNRTEPEIADIDQGLVDISPYYVELTLEHYERLRKKYSRNDDRMYRALLESYSQWLKENVKKASLYPESKYLSPLLKEYEAKKLEILLEISHLPGAGETSSVLIYKEAESLLIKFLSTSKENEVPISALEEVELLLAMSGFTDIKVEEAQRLCWVLRQKRR